MGRQNEGIADGVDGRGVDNDAIVPLQRLLEEVREFGRCQELSRIGRETAGRKDAELFDFGRTNRLVKSCVAGKAVRQAWLFALVEKQPRYRRFPQVGIDKQRRYPELGAGDRVIRAGERFALGREGAGKQERPAQLLATEE